MAWQPMSALVASQILICKQGVRPAKRDGADQLPSSFCHNNLQISPLDQPSPPH